MLRNRWVRRTVIGLGVGVVAIVAAYFYYRHSINQKGLDRHAAIASHLDATDPRWQLHEIEIDRKDLPDDQNSALLVPRIKAVLAGKEFMPVRPDNRIGIWVDVPPNCVLDEEGAAALDSALAGNDAALALARSFKDYPRGLRRYNYSPDFIGTLLPDLQECRQIAALLDGACERYCRDGRPGAALELIQAMLGLCRSIDNEPFLVSSLVRIAIASMVARRVERTLGLTTPKARLPELQAALLREADSDSFWTALRGERAGMDMFFTNLRTGRLPAGTAAALAGGPRASLSDQFRDWAQSPRRASEHAEYLEAVTRALETRQLPEPEQRIALKEIEVPGTENASGLGRLVLPTFSKLHDASLRTRAHLRCAAVAIAVERYRQKHGRWPNTLGEVPEILLPAIPADPFNLQPLRFLSRDDGVTIYSVGMDGVDDGGLVVDHVPQFPQSANDLGFRLFNPEARGLPSAPRPVTQPDPANPGRLPEPGPMPRDISIR